MNKASEENKLVVDRMTMLGKQIDSIVPQIGSMMKEEIRGLKELIPNQGAVSSFNLGSTPSVGSSSSIIVPSTLVVPNDEDLKKMFRKLGSKEEQLDLFVEKYSRKISWANYNNIMTGKMPSKAIRSFVESLRDA